MPRSFERDAHRLDVAEAAAAHADGRGDLLGHVEAIGGEVDVVGDERHARADDGRAGRRMRRAPGRSRAPTLAAASSPPAPRTRRGGCLRDCGAPASRRPPRRETRAARSRARNLGARPRARASTQSCIVAPSIGMNGHDVDGAEARMLAVMLPQIDRRYRFLIQSEDGLLQRRAIAGKREHRAVMGRVGLDVQHACAGDGMQGVGDAGDDVGIPSLADVRNALDDGHVVFIVAARRIQSVGGDSRALNNSSPPSSPAPSHHPSHRSPTSGLSKRHSRRCAHKLRPGLADADLWTELESRGLRLGCRRFRPARSTRSSRATRWN